DGRAMILTEGILRARYRTSLTVPELLEPDALYELRLDLWATANVFLPGHRIRLRSEEHTSELQSLAYLVCRLLLEKKKPTTCAMDRTSTTSRSSMIPPTNDDPHLHFASATSPAGSTLPSEPANLVRASLAISLPPT